jgi:hypothetical protein
MSTITLGYDNLRAYEQALPGMVGHPPIAKQRRRCVPALRLPARR